MHSIIFCCFVISAKLSRGLCVKMKLVTAVRCCFDVAEGEFAYWRHCCAFVVGLFMASLNGSICDVQCDMCYQNQSRNSILIQDMLMKINNVMSNCVFVGPRRVNHASVAISDFIYSFGGYCSGEDYRSSRSMDVHVLNTNNLRWTLLPIDKNLKYPKVPFQRYGELKIARMCVMQTQNVLYLN